MGRSWPTERTRRRIPEATVARLPVYLRILVGAGRRRGRRASRPTVSPSSPGVNAAKVRKDLCYLGSYGTRGVGYEVEYLVYQIRRELGLTHDWPVVIVGAGNLGQALAGYGGFGERGFPVAGIVDIDPAKVGSVVGGVRVRHIDELSPRSCSREASRIGVIATPPARPRRTPPTASSLPASPASSTSRRSCSSRARRRSRSARSTSPSSCRSSATTSSAGPRPQPPRRCMPFPASADGARAPRVVAACPSRHRCQPPQRAAQLLERVAVPGATSAKAVAGLARGTTSAKRSCSRTCNRTEVYAVAERFHGAYADIRDFFCELGDLAPDELHPHLYSQHDDAAVTHLFEVAAGLDSAVLGETEILGQVRNAWEIAQARRWRPLDAEPAVPSRHLEAGKRARTETGDRPRHRLGQPRRGRDGRPSDSATSPASGCWSSAPVRWARASPWRCVAPAPPTSSSPTARTSGATVLADRVDGSCRRYRPARRRDRRRRRARHRARGADQALLDQVDRRRCRGAASTAPAAARRHRRAPRRRRRRWPNCTASPLLDLDDLRAWADRGSRSAPAEAERVRTIVGEEVERFVVDVTARQAAPLVAQLHERAERSSAPAELDRFSLPARPTLDAPAARVGRGAHPGDRRQAAARAVGPPQGRRPARRRASATPPPLRDLFDIG